MSTEFWERLIRLAGTIRGAPQKTPLFFVPEIPSTDQFSHISSTNLRTADMPQYRSHGNTSSFNNNSFNTVSYNWTAADDRSQVLAWLSPLEPGLRHRDIQDSRAENIGEWVLQTEEFRSWYAGSGGSESDNAVLLCHGDPGVGKSFIR